MENGYIPWDNPRVRSRSSGFKGTDTIRPDKGIPLQKPEQFRACRMNPTVPVVSLVVNRDAVRFLAVVQFHPELLHFGYCFVRVNVVIGRCLSVKEVCARLFKGNNL